MTEQQIIELEASKSFFEKLKLDLELISGSIEQ